MSAAAALETAVVRPVVEFRRLSKIYGTGEAEVRALDGVDLTILPRQFVAIMGASGSGKSTAMNVIGCLDVPTAGHYRFRGVDVGSLDSDQRALLRRNYIGFVFQGFNLLARTTALENVELPLVYRRVKAGERRERAMARAFGRRPCRSRQARAERALRRAATARGDRARAGHRAVAPSRGRAHGQPRLGAQGRDHGAARAAQRRARDHHRDGHPRAGHGRIRHPRGRLQGRADRRRICRWPRSRS